jgi:uncharacterized protein
LSFIPRNHFISNIIRGNFADIFKIIFSLLLWLRPAQANFKLIIPDHIIIEQTRKWVKAVVIGCHFCPFAAPVVSADSIQYTIIHKGVNRQYLDALQRAFRQLDNDASVETTLLIFPEALQSFTEYLNFVKRAEAFLQKKGYEGKYQLATFHPDYVFTGAEENDAANYTNRSIYPMLHILREKSLSKVLQHFPQPESIPERNMTFARKKGLNYMIALRESCMTTEE